LPLPTLRHRSTLLLTLLVVAICALLLLPIRVPPALARWHALSDDLENFGHPLVFAVLGITVLRGLRHRFAWPSLKPAVLALAAGLLLGSTTEYVQTMVGRDGAWNDVLGDMVGCLSGVAGQLWLEFRRDPQRRRQGLAPLAVAAITAMIAIAPLGWTLVAYTARAHESPLFWRVDSTPMQRFAHWKSGRYPGLVIQEPPADWRGYRNLVIDVANQRTSGIELNVRVHDRWHDDSFSDRFNTHLVLAAGTSQSIRIPLERIRRAPRTREMDMSWIRGVGVFVTAPETLAGLQVRRLYFER